MVEEHSNSDSDLITPLLSVNSCIPPTFLETTGVPDANDSIAALGMFSAKEENLVLQIGRTKKIGIKAKKEHVIVQVVRVVNVIVTKKLKNE
jgi:hypothetical protein